MTGGARAPLLLLAAHLARARDCRELGRDVYAQSDARLVAPGCDGMSCGRVPYTEPARRAERRFAAGARCDRGNASAAIAAAGGGGGARLLVWQPRWVTNFGEALQRLPALAEGERGGLGGNAPARRKPRPLAASICVYTRPSSLQVYF